MYLLIVVIPMGMPELTANKVALLIIANIISVRPVYLLACRQVKQVTLARVTSAVVGWGYSTAGFVTHCHANLFIPLAWQCF